jgi:hypothetical protein
MTSRYANGCPLDGDREGERANVLVPREGHMRTILLRVIAGAGLGLSFLVASSAGSVPLATPTAVKSAIEALSVTDVVHCRRYPHAASIRPAA